MTTNLMPIMDNVCMINTTQIESVYPTDSLLPYEVKMLSGETFSLNKEDISLLSIIVNKEMDRG